MIIPAGFVQANLKYTGVSHPQGAEWTIGLDRGGFVGGLEDLADAVAAAESGGGGPRDFRVDTSILSSILVKEGPNETGPAVEKGYALPGPLALPGTTPGVAMLVRKLTAIGGRKGRGRTFYPGTADGLWSAAGAMVSGDRDTAQATWDQFLSDLQAVGLDPVVLHSDATAPTPITALSVDLRSATQRRRMR